MCECEERAKAKKMSRSDLCRKIAVEAGVSTNKELQRLLWAVVEQLEKDETRERTTGQFMKLLMCTPYEHNDEFE